MMHGTSIREESRESGYDVRDTCVRASVCLSAQRGAGRTARGTRVYDNDNRYVLL